MKGSALEMFKCYFFAGCVDETGEGCNAAVELCEETCV